MTLSSSNRPRPRLLRRMSCHSNNPSRLRSEVVATNVPRRVRRRKPASTNAARRVAQESRSICQSRDACGSVMLRPGISWYSLRMRLASETEGVDLTSVIGIHQFAVTARAVAARPCRLIPNAPRESAPQKFPARCQHGVSINEHKRAAAVGAPLVDDVRRASPVIT